MCYEDEDLEEYDETCFDDYDESDEPEELNFDH